MQLDANFAFMSAADDANYEFLDLLSPSYALPNMTEDQYAMDPSMLHPGSAHFSFGADMLGRIDFAAHDSADDDVASYYSGGHSPYMTPAVPDMPGMSPGPSSTDPSPSSRPYHNTTCRCLSSIYFAMAALANLPPVGLAAMKVARSACKVAHDVIQCPKCSRPLLSDPSRPLPVQSFQNMMMLGALIPTVANAYAHILRLVDREAQQATRDNLKIFFAFSEAGGLWGEFARKENDCGIVQGYDNRDLEPELWRQTVRAMLKVDIYGYKFDKAPEGRHVHHLGLKDVIDALEERSRIRHALVDEMVAKGQMTPQLQRNLLPILHGPEQEKKRNCSHIIELARGALDKLVIP
jgi:hypothetical protein